MILYVYVVGDSEGEAIAVTGSAKKALVKAADYVADCVPLEDGKEKPEILDKAGFSDLKKKLKTDAVTVSYRPFDGDTEITATVKKFNLE